MYISTMCFNVPITLTSVNCKVRYVRGRTIKGNSFVPLRFENVWSPVVEWNQNIIDSKILKFSIFDDVTSCIGDVVCGKLKRPTSPGFRLDWA